MKNVTLLVRKGPLAGSRLELELGRVAIGREPGPGGVLLPGDSLVSRRHGELLEENGSVVYRNLSTNGTLVDRRIVQEAIRLEPGMELRLGNEYLIEVQFQRDRRAGLMQPGPVVPAGPPWSRGLLAKPLVRVVLGVYLVMILALGFWLGTREDRTLAADFEPVRRMYLGHYQRPGLSAEEKKARLAQADHLVRELVALEREERWPEAQALCRELMAIDPVPASPLYKFGARQLGSLADRR